MSVTARYHLATRTARAIVAGPYSIWPPRSRDPIGWLVPSLRLTRCWRQPHPEESIAVYTDGTANRKKRFLPPLLRWARWDRLGDLRRVQEDGNPWPVVLVRVGTIGDWPSVASFAKRVQRQLRRAPLGVCFSARRDTPALRVPRSFSWLGVRASNGLQTMDYESPAIAGDRLTSLIVEGFKLLAETLEPTSTRGWEEWYDTDPTARPTGRLGGWTRRYTRAGLTRAGLDLVLQPVDGRQ